MNNWKKLLLALLLTAPPGHAAENAVLEELVWSQSDGLRQEIYHSARTAAGWSEPEQLTDNNANNLHPAFVIAPDSSRWIFWSAVNPDGISIEYTVGKAGRWTQPVQLESGHATAITPAALIGPDQTLWLAWAGNDGGQDEIYWSRFVNAAWLPPQQINAANQVPDVKPELLLNKQGQVEVRWQGFRDGKYKWLAAVYAGQGWSPEQDFIEEEEQAAEPEELPDFLPADSQHVLLAVPAGKEAE
ncbi:hypothetical protein [Candidatus Electronema sp. JC]|uniref:hypothetical protein n=1 Tax=Candidatus Electronema sp. JC TaxID=3401570 RepID=UPI003AA9113B